MNVLGIVFVSVFFGSLALIVIVVSLSNTIREMSIRVSENRLKVKMVERGYSAEEIERVFAADGDLDLEDLKELDRKSGRSRREDRTPQPPIK